MPDKLNLFICEELFREVESALRSNGLSDVQMIAYPIEWTRRRIDWSMVAALKGENGPTNGRNVIVITEKMGLILDPPKDMGHWEKVIVREFSDLLLTRSESTRFDGEGAHTILPLRLDHYLDVDLSEIMPSDAPFERIVLLDAFDIDGTDGRVDQLEAKLGIPCQRIRIDPEVLQLNISRVVLTSMLDAETEGHRYLQNTMDKTKADYAMIFDVLERISRIRDEENVIGSVLDLFIILFSPRTIMYASENDGKTERIFSRGRTLSTVWDPHKVAELCGTASYALTPTGFCLQIKSMGATLGWMEAINIEFPLHRDRYLELAMAICDVFGLSISNARAFQEMKRMQDVILDLNEAMRLINKTMRHDILNEMAITSGALQLYRSKHDERKLDMAENSILRSIKLIGDMRELESGMLANKAPEALSIRTVLNTVLSTFDLPISIEGDDAIVAADGALPSVLENIIRNAIIHGGTDRVQVIVRSTDDDCIVSVIDWGRGIPDDIKQKVFGEGFSYGATAGSGVGLFIVMKVMKRYGGSVSIRDNTPRGTIIDLTIPLAKGDPSEKA